jgi:hypothetical protein
MGMFSNILDKLGFDNRAARRASATPPPRTPQTGPVERPSGAAAKPDSPQQTAPPIGTSTTQVDVMGKLESLAATNPQKLNWRESIVDLLKLLGMDSSMTARKELAAELGCPADKMGDSAQMNMWLHKALLQKLAENGGNIPKELLH